MSVLNAYVIEKYKQDEIKELMIGGYCSDKKIDSTDPIRKQYEGNILKDYCLSGDIDTNVLSVVKNIKPHAFYECMLMDMEEKVNSGIDELTEEMRKKIFDISHSFVSYVSESEVMDRYELAQGNFQLVYNYDPATLDRESGMSEKRFHLHLSYWPKWEFCLNARKIESLSALEKTLFLDPILVASESILYDYFRDKLKMGQLIVPKQGGLTEFPYGLMIRYNGWDVLKSDLFQKEIVDIHILMKELYKRISECFFVDDCEMNQLWKRKELNDPYFISEKLNELEFLSLESKEYLDILAVSMRDIPDGVMRRLQDKRQYRIQMLSLNGLSYSFGMFTVNSNSKESRLKDQSEVYAVIQPKLFSAIGGAGLPYSYHNPVIVLKRNAYSYDDIKINKHEAFQKEFLDYYERNH